MRLLVLILCFPSICFADDWTNGDMIREGIYTGLTLIDGAQTRWFLKHPITTMCCQRYQESNPILGPNPSIGKVDNLVLASIIAHGAIAYILPRDLREGWQYIWIGIEGNAVAHNHSMGIKVNF